MHRNDSSVLDKAKPAASVIGHKTADGMITILKAIGIETLTKREKYKLIAKAAVPALIVGMFFGHKRFIS